MTERQLVVVNKDARKFRFGDILAVISENETSYNVVPVADAVVRVNPSAPNTIDKSECTKLLGVKIVHDELAPEPPRTFPLDDMNDICEKCGRAYCDCEYKY